MKTPQHRVGFEATRHLPESNETAFISRLRSSLLPLQHTKRSDNILFTPRTEKKVLHATAEKRRLATLQRNREKRDSQKMDTINFARAEKIYVFEEALNILHSKSCTLAEFLDYVFNPKCTMESTYDWCWTGFFKNKNAVRKILGYWTTSDYSISARELVNTWAMEQAQKVVAEEARAICKDGLLSKTKRTINESFFLDYSILSLTKCLKDLAPVFFGILGAFSVTTRQKTQLTEKWEERKMIVSDFTAINFAYH